MVGLTPSPGPATEPWEAFSGDSISQLDAVRKNHVFIWHLFYNSVRVVASVVCCYIHTVFSKE